MQYNDAQRAILERHWEESQILGQKLPYKAKHISIVEEINRVGPTRIPRVVATYFNQRLSAPAPEEPTAPIAPKALITKAATSQSTSIKTPRQLAILHESWDRNPYPMTAQFILLVHETGLSRMQVRSWFKKQRQSTGKRTRHVEMSSKKAAGLWARYEADKEGFVADLRSGKIDSDTRATCGRERSEAEDEDRGDEVMEGLEEDEN